MFSFRVRDTEGRDWPGLIGVFRRHFAIAVGSAAATGQPQSVTYYGDAFTICPAPKCVDVSN